MAADECLSLYGTPFRVYVADSIGLGVPYRTGVQGPNFKLHMITLLPINIALSARITPSSRHDP